MTINHGNHENYQNPNHDQVCAGPCVDKEGEMVCPFVKWQWEEVMLMFEMMILVMVMVIIL